MGLILCQIHGDSGFATRFSEKIIGLIKNDAKIEECSLRIFIINIFDNEDNELLFAEQYLLLEDEFISMNLSESVSVDSEEEYNSYFSRLPALDGICANCLRDYKKKHSLNLLNFN